MALRFLVLFAGFLSGCGASATQSGAGTATPAQQHPVATPATTGGGAAPDGQAPAVAPAPGAPIGQAPAVAQYHTQLVADASALPPCTAEAESWLIYVKSDQAFRVCASAAWESIDVKGADGAAGKDGADGAAGQNGTNGRNGVDGQNGVGWSIVSQHLCTSSADLDTASDTMTIGSSIFVTEFATGDYLISCMDRRIDSTFTFSDSASSATVFSATSNGVLSGEISCLGYYAVANFNLATKTATWSKLGDGTPQAVTCTGS